MAVRFLDDEPASSVSSFVGDIIENSTEKDHCCRIQVVSLNSLDRAKEGATIPYLFSA